MRTTKIQISPEMREFNELVEHADWLLDFQFDQEPADILLMRLQQAKCYPESSRLLASAIAGIAVKQIRPSCHCGNQNASWHGDNYNLRQFMCDKCWSDEQTKQ